MRSPLAWIPLIALSFTSTTLATSYGPPKRQELYSENRKFLLVVDPETEIHKISPASDPESTSWEFQLRVWHFPFVLSNDGKTVAVVAWKHVQEEALNTEDCITFFSADGTKTGVSFKDVYPDPPKTSAVGVGPIGDFWRTWYQSVESKGDLLVIHTTGGGEAIFELNRHSLVSKKNIGYHKPQNHTNLRIWSYLP